MHVRLRSSYESVWSSEAVKKNSVEMKAGDSFSLCSKDRVWFKFDWRSSKRIPYSQGTKAKNIHLYDIELSAQVPELSAQVPTSQNFTKISI